MKPEVNAAFAEKKKQKRPLWSRWWVTLLGSIALLTLIGWSSVKAMLSPRPTPERAEIACNDFVRSNAPPRDTPPFSGSIQHEVVVRDAEGVSVRCAVGWEGGEWRLLALEPLRGSLNR